MLGKGQTLEQILEEIGQVAEAVSSTAEVWKLAQRHEISAPIIEQVDRLLRDETTVDQAVEELLSREQTTELAD